MTVYWRASDDPNGTSLRAETWAAAAGERSWKNVDPQLKPWRGWRLCARWRAWLRFLCDRSCGGNDPVEEISKPVATGLADVSTTRRVSMQKSLQHSCHALARHTGVGLERQAFPCKCIHHTEHSQAPPSCC